MSGHSKWSKIKHKKGVADAKRGAVFTKLGNAITVAAKKGGSDPDMNFSLRLAIEKAKQGNMPKENIERAIKRGTGKGNGASLEEIIYEGFGPNKIPIIIQCLTDNKNRTVSEIKHILERYGGSLAGPGSVMWQFQRLGALTINSKQPTINNIEELELQLIDAGAEDVEVDEEEIIVYTKPEDLQKVKENIEKLSRKLGIKIDSADIEFVPKNKKDISDKEGEKAQKLFDALDEHDDVSNYYTNLK